MLWVVAVAAGVVPGAEGAEAPPSEVLLAEALEANGQLSELAGGLAEENARLRARDAERDAQLERMRADLAVLQRMLFGRSSEKTRPGVAARLVTARSERARFDSGWLLVPVAFVVLIILRFASLALRSIELTF